MSEPDASSYDPDVLPRRDDGLALLTNDSIRARRRPRAVLWMWGWETVLAFLVAYPAAGAMRDLYGSHPRGDAVLWSPGALELTDFMMRQAPARAAILAMALLVLVVAALSAMLVSIAFVTRDRRPPTTRAAFARGMVAVPSLAALMAGAVVLQIVLLFFGGMAAFGVTSGLADRVGEARAEQLGWLTGLLFVFAATLVGVTHDLARAAAVRFRVRALRAVRLGMNTMRRAPVSISFSWAWRALASLAPLAVGSLVADAIGMRAGFALFVLFGVHQLALVTRVALRASWLAKALRAVDHAHRVIRV